MLSVGNKFPEFKLTAVNGTSPESFSEATLETYAGQWKIIFFWPKDFTLFVQLKSLALENLKVHLKIEMRF